MPRYGKQREKYLMERVRGILAFNPRLGVHAIREKLRYDPADPVTIDPHYLLKLKNKIDAERKFRLDTTKVTERISQMQDTTAAVIEHFIELLISPSVEPKDRVAAGKAILAADKALFEAEMDAGVFERQLGSLTFKHKLLIDPERKAAIIGAFVNIGLIKPTNNQPTIDVQSTAAPTTAGTTAENGDAGTTPTA